jgi:hypothetical protein
VYWTLGFYRIGCGPDNRGIVVWLRVAARGFSLPHSLHTGCGVQPAPI